jgi:hypothetical protein
LQTLEELKTLEGLADPMFLVQQLLGHEEECFYAQQGFQGQEERVFALKCPVHRQEG